MLCTPATGWPHTLSTAAAWFCTRFPQARPQVVENHGIRWDPTGFAPKQSWPEPLADPSGEGVDISHATGNGGRTRKLSGGSARTTGPSGVQAGRRRRARPITGSDPGEDAATDGRDHRAPQARVTGGPPPVTRGRPTGVPGPCHPAGSSGRRPRPGLLGGPATGRTPVVRPPTGALGPGRRSGPSTRSPAGIPSGCRPPTGPDGPGHPRPEPRHRSQGDPRSGDAGRTAPAPSPSRQGRVSGTAATPATRARPLARIPRGALPRFVVVRPDVYPTPAPSPSAATHPSAKIVRPGRGVAVPRVRRTGPAGRRGCAARARRWGRR